MDNRYECGCERGGDCTKTTMCAVQSALEDAEMNDNNWEVNATGTQRTLDEKDLEIERLKADIKGLQEDCAMWKEQVDKLTMRNK